MFSVLEKGSFFSVILRLFLNSNFLTRFCPLRLMKILFFLLLLASGNLQWNNNTNISKSYKLQKFKGKVDLHLYSFTKGYLRKRITFCHVIAILYFYSQDVQCASS